MVGGHVGAAVPVVSFHSVGKTTQTPSDQFTIAVPIGVSVHVSPAWVVDFEVVVASDVKPWGGTGLTIDPGVVYVGLPVALGLRTKFDVSAPANFGLIPLIHKGIVDVGYGQLVRRGGVPDHRDARRGLCARRRRSHRLRLLREEKETEMPTLKGTKTHANLKAAFAGESQANRRYLYFAKVADVEGFPEVAGNFRDTAEGETGHAHGHLDYLKQVGDPATDLPIGDTMANLKAAVAGETHEYTDMYPGMAKNARDEGFAEIADWFETLAKAEKAHAGRFQALLAKLG